MPDYKAPIRDIHFVLYDLLGAEEHYQRIGAEETSRDLVEAIITEGGRFAESILAPLHRVGDKEGCKFNNGVVTTPPGFKEAYAQYVAGGWPSLAGDPEYGGQGLPGSLSVAINELVSTANWAWEMYPGLSQGAKLTLAAYGTEAQKQTYLTKLTSGEWTGTMCLTESHCGTDLGLLKTRAEPEANGSYRIEGTKIFISAGEHDMAENIVHIVLARLPDAPRGTKGISLFVVPKLNAETLVPNNVNCGSIEQKMGIHGNATCVLNFDGAVGNLIGPPNGGLHCMFTFMNFARLGTALQGMAAAEQSYQGALSYARERIAMRALSGPKNPKQAADPIIFHPDVRRMLLTQRAIAEGGRALIYFCAMQGDILDSGNPTEEEKKEAEALMNVYRGDKEAIALKNKIVILIDDGIATGNTIFAAIKSVKSKKPKKIIVAVPVLPPDTIGPVEKVVDELIYIDAPPMFGAIGRFYEFFGQTRDEEVVEIMKKV